MTTKIGVIDIGSGQVKGGIVDLSNVKLEVLSTTHELNFAHEPPKLKEFLLTLTAKLLLIRKELEERGWVERWVIFLPAPLYAAQTKVLSRSFAKSQVVEIKDLTELSNAEAKEFLANYRGLYPELHDDTPVLLENKVMEVRLNGYICSAPLGKRANLIEMTQYLSLTARPILGRLTKIFNLSRQRSVEFHSYAFALFSVLRDTRPELKNYLLLDSGGRLVDLSLVINDCLMENLTFPFGERRLIANLEPQLGGKTAAASYLKLAESGKLDAVALSQLERHLQRIKEPWLKLWRLRLRELAKRHLLPAHLLVVTDDLAGQIFAHWIKNDRVPDLWLGCSGPVVETIRRLPGHLDLPLGVITKFCAKIQA